MLEGLSALAIQCELPPQVPLSFNAASIAHGVVAQFWVLGSRVQRAFRSNSNRVVQICSDATH